MEREKVKLMQRVTNCVLFHQNSVLMIKKPRRGWWYVPGGKMEPQETVLDSVKREVAEETGLKVADPALKGIFTIVIEENGVPADEWMLFTFYAEKWSGSPFLETKEGELAWHSVFDLDRLPMPEGDRMVLKQIVCKKDQILFGRFVYTPEYQLLDYRLDGIREKMMGS